MGKRGRLVYRPEVGGEERLDLGMPHLRSEREGPLREEALDLGEIRERRTGTPHAHDPLEASEEVRRRFERLCRAEADERRIESELVPRLRGYHKQGRCESGLILKHR